MSDVTWEVFNPTWQELLHPLTGRVDVRVAFTVALAHTLCKPTRLETSSDSFREDIHAHPIISLFICALLGNMHFWKAMAAHTGLLTMIVDHPPQIIHLAGSFPGNGWRENQVLTPFLSGYEVSCSARVERSCIPWVLSCIRIYKSKPQLLTQYSSLLQN